nr:2-alkenal reductase (NADP(+)-dependent)-like [Tanacetum cinerariifolium]
MQTEDGADSVKFGWIQVKAISSTMMKDCAAVVGNKQIIFKNYTNELPSETNMELKLDSKIKLKAPENGGGVVVKNMYLSCDTYMRGRMRDRHDSWIPPFLPGSV